MALTFTHEYTVNDKDIKETYSISNKLVSEECYHKLLSDYTDNLVYKQPLSNIQCKAMVGQSKNLKDVVKHIRKLKINDAARFLQYVLEENFMSAYNISTVDTLRNNANMLNQIADQVEETEFDYDDLDE